LELAKRSRPTIEEEEVMETVHSADGTVIAFDRSGEGPALVLVVGAFSDRTSTKTLASGLASRFTVYEYDRRGRGDSGDTAPYAVEREVEDLAAIVEATGRSPHVFGHSSGGAIALEAGASGVAVRALCVYEPPYAGTDGPTFALADQLAELIASGREDEAVERFLTLMGTPADVLEQMKAGPQWDHMRSFAPTLSNEVRLCNDGSVPTERLGKVAVPTLALAGGASPPWAREVAAAVAAAVPDGRDRVLEGQGHGVADDVIIPVLAEFFA
jgi:pimeloyl-ACP methyl ester carboxylesterase